MRYRIDTRYGGLYFPEINKLQEQYDKMELRYARDEISKDIFKKHGLKVKEQIEKKKQLQGTSEQVDDAGMMKLV